MSAGEGVVRFRLDQRPGPPPTAAELAPLRAWHRICHALRLVGQRPDRYGGYAYGNLSRRSGDGFLISGTQTGGREELGAGDYARVLAWDLEHNRVVACGPTRPSSESLTHAALYDAMRTAGFVIHAHSPEIWRHAGALGLPVTDPAVAYGTPEMAAEVLGLFRSGTLEERGLFAMGGHEDGIVAYGPDDEAAGELLVTTLARAFQL